MRKFTTNFFIIFFNILRLACVFFLILMLIRFSLPWLTNAEKYPGVIPLLQLEQKISTPLITWIQQKFPYMYEGVDYSRLMLAIAVILLQAFFGLIVRRLHVSIFRHFERHR